MQGETKEQWQKLCEQAAVEQDPEKLLELAKEISALLDEKEQRLHRARTIKLPNTGSDGYAA
jgi:hypothetical protein